MTAFDPALAARIASSRIPLSADLVQDTDRMTAEREAEILKFRDDCHPVTGVLAAARVHDSLADLVAEMAAVRKERDEAQAQLERRTEDLAFLERATLPEMRRTIQRHEDGKKRWRDRAQKAEPERDALQERLHQVAMAQVWTNEDGKRFVFADDIAHAVFDLKPGTEAAS